MKKRLAMIVTMLMVTVSMAACGGKKDTTADKESVINTEATEEVAETEEPETEELEAATETEEPETEEAEEQETTGKLENNTASTTATTAQPSDNNTTKSNKNKADNSNTKSSAGSTATAGTTTSNTGGTTGSSNNTNTSGNSAAPAHVHTWVLHEGSGHYETQVVKEAWDEPVYETQCRSICNRCGADITGNTDQHFIDNIVDGELTCGSYHAEWVQVQTGTIHHDAETKQVYVQDVAPYAQCSGCGEIGPVGSGISIN
ncbi:hypothetical protein LKD47_09625 [Roseburia sp. CLA-AA-H204]|uniref:Lipoprotein n=1 Tax=Roseburia amylophila TaxID=2981794 RepID=A0AAW4WGS8_9FIRM|nr:hypothetical protein [Roseburia amylophila]MCC2242554.1 hypothetical protein [Roseburia amylophila]